MVIHRTAVGGADELLLEVRAGLLVYRSADELGYNDVEREACQQKVIDGIDLLADVLVDIASLRSTMPLPLGVIRSLQNFAMIVASDARDILGNSRAVDLKSQCAKILRWQAAIYADRNRMA